MPPPTWQVMTRLVSRSGLPPATLDDGPTKPTKATGVYRAEATSSGIPRAARRGAETHDLVDVLPEVVDQQIAIGEIIGVVLIPKAEDDSDAAMAKLRVDPR